MAWCIINTLCDGTFFGKGKTNSLRIIYVAGGVSTKCSVLSRSKAKALSYGHIEEPLVIISITDIGSAPVIFAENEQIKAVLRAPLMM